MDYLSLFSGIGGFEYGIQQSNKAETLNCIGFSEVDKYATSIYTKHFPNHYNWGDATTINTNDLPSFDLLVGGFPCQSFSNAGNKQGFNDTRGTLFFEIARICAEKKPKYFLLENVRGLLHHDKGRTFKEILRVLTSLGYRVEWQVLNSQDFGVPQNRERIYIVGCLGNRSGREVFPFPFNSKKDSVQQSMKKISNTPHSGKGMKIYENTKQKWKEAYEGDGINIGRPLSNRRGRVGKGIVNTLTTSCEQATIDKGRLRRLTPVEYERLQGFPDQWTRWSGDGTVISDSQRYKCLGNAITTNVITAIMNEWGLV